MADISTTRHNHALPKQWADEIALVSSAPTTTSTVDTNCEATCHNDTPPTPPVPGSLFDRQLDGFLDRFQQEIHCARELKDNLDQLSSPSSTVNEEEYALKKHEFKLKMEHIRSLFATEGEDFLASLEKRNPHFTMAACGQNTIELAQGIDRLETAVREEETKRATQTSSSTTPTNHTTATSSSKQQQQLQNQSQHNRDHPSYRQQHSLQPTIVHRAPSQPIITHHQQQQQQQMNSSGIAAGTGSPPRQVSIPLSMQRNAAPNGSRVRPDVHVSPLLPMMQTRHASMATLHIGSSGINESSGDRAVAPIPSSSVGHALHNLSSDETLQLMQSDIQALKLELMRLQRSKASNGGYGTPHSLPTRSIDPAAANSSPVSPGQDDNNTVNTSSPSTHMNTNDSNGSVDNKDTDSDKLPASILANNNVNVVRVKGRAIAPTYVSHLEQMKSRIEALEKKPLSRRAKSVARLGRTHTMGSMYEPTSAQYHQLHHPHHLHPQTNTISQMMSSPKSNIQQQASQDTQGQGCNVPTSSQVVPGDENQNPNVTAMITPPRNLRRSKHRSISTGSPLAPISGTGAPGSNTTSPTTSPHHMYHHHHHHHHHHHAQVRRSPPSRLSPSSQRTHRFSPPLLQAANPNRGSPPVTATLANDPHRFTIATSSPSSTASPKRPSFTDSPGAASSSSPGNNGNNGANTGGSNSNNGNNNNGTARLFFDAPEDMLSRPQSYAAARDIQRYSLKVARRFIPAGAHNSMMERSASMASVSESGAGGGGGVSTSGATTTSSGVGMAKSDMGSNSNPPNAHLLNMNMAMAMSMVEPRSKSAVAPSATKHLKDGSSAAASTTGVIGPTLSDVGNTTTANHHAVPTSTTTPPVIPPAAPSTIDTSGSGGRVVEEIEGNMWVRKGVVWKRWRRRYASIITHQFLGRCMCLFSYSPNGSVDSTKSQVVVLHGSLCRALKDTVEINGQMKFIFVVRTSSKEYHFAAESDDVRRTWIRELRDAARDESKNVSLTQQQSTSGSTKGGRSMAFRKRG